MACSTSHLRRCRGGLAFGRPSGKTRQQDTSDVIVARVANVQQLPRRVGDNIDLRENAQASRHTEGSIRRRPTIACTSKNEKIGRCETPLLHTSRF